jgi:hypothetical protein
VIPTVIANAFYLPRHLLPKAEPQGNVPQQGNLARPRKATVRTE